MADIAPGPLLITAVDDVIDIFDTACIKASVSLSGIIFGNCFDVNVRELLYNRPFKPIKKQLKKLFGNI